MHRFWRDNKISVIQLTVEEAVVEAYERKMIAADIDGRLYCWLSQKYISGSANNPAW